MTMFDPIPPPGHSLESQASASQHSSIEERIGEHSNGQEINGSPFRSNETFGAYCDLVQNRLAGHARERRHFLQAAYDRLTILLQAARAVEDGALCTELWGYREAAGELLEVLGRLPQTFHEEPTLPAHHASFLSAQGENGRGIPGSGRSTGRAPASPLIGPDKVRASRAATTGVHRAAISSAFPGQSALPEGERNPGPRLPRRAVRPLADIETDAVRLRETVRTAKDKCSLLTEGGELNVVNCLRLRAAACRQRRLEEEAGDTEVAEVIELANDIIGQLDTADDQEYTVALDYELTPAPTAYQWGELAERYEEMSRAQEAFEWWVGNNGLLTVNDVQPLAESVAAVQQRFNRLLFRIGARDPFQQQLFDDLRAWAREAQCYLQSLRPKVPMMELVERAMTLEPAWANVRAALEDNQMHAIPPDGLPQ